MDEQAQANLSVIEAVLRDELGIEGPLTVERSLRSDLGLDSADALVLAVELERRLGIDLQAEPVTLETVGDVVAFLGRSQRRATVCA